MQMSCAKLQLCLLESWLMRVRLSVPCNSQPRSNCYSSKSSPSSWHLINDSFWVLGLTNGNVGFPYEYE